MNNVLQDKKTTKY